MKKIIFELGLDDYELLREAAFINKSSKSAWVRAIVKSALAKKPHIELNQMELK